MDPDVTLREIREALDLWLALDGSDTTLCASNVDYLCERVEVLDNWLSRGGFPPSAWTAKARIEARS